MANVKHELLRKVEKAPHGPGVYLFKDAAGKPIYIGKAKSLHLRLASYFQDSRFADGKRDHMLEGACDVETILVDNEKEAVLLENNLIKRFHPRYNILLRDDKTYPYVKLTVGEGWPRVYVTRRLKKDGSLYYGPYFPARLAYQIVDLIHRRFGLPSCSVDLTRDHPRPCLQYYIKRCQGPCVAGLTTAERYRRAVQQVRLLLAGREGELLRDLEQAMAEAAEKEQYEEAARCRDLLSTLGELRERQKMAAARGGDADVFGFHQEGPLLAVNLFHVHHGHTVDRREFFWEDLLAFNAREFFSTLLAQIYLDQQHVPDEILTPVDFEDAKLLEDLVSERRQRPVQILVPQGGWRRALLELVARNARHSFEQRFRVRTPPAEKIASALAEGLDLEKPPRRIECFDISHMQGTDVVASMVVWEDGRMKKSDYRKFILRSAPSNDDFASMREVVGRRYRRLRHEGKPLPDLILVDGGVGQLHAAQAALEMLGIINQPLASIAKKEEILHVLGKENEPVVLDRHSPVLHLVQQIRDEAHRFAVRFHRQRRSNRGTSSELLRIPGVGERTATKLLAHFGSVQAIRQLSEEELSQVVRRTQARLIHSHMAASYS